MTTNKRPETAKERSWRQAVRRWQASGLSVRAFCERERLSEPSFYAWRRTLRERAAAAVTFVPVQVCADDATVDGSRGVSGGLELVLGGGRTLRVGAGFDAATLRRLLALLEEGRPC